MPENLIINSVNNEFEKIKKIDNNGIEYWEGRNLMPLLGYSKWQTAEEVIARAAMACFNSGQIVDNHFHLLVKIVDIGSNTVRKVKNWKLDRYACYLIAQNGDSKKPAIAMAQTYFAIQTRKQEILEQFTGNDERLKTRSDITLQNKNLFSTAKKAGVTKFGSFNNSGYQGLYGGMTLNEIENKKNIKKGDLLNRAGATELAANLFRITQTNEIIKKDNITGESEASNLHFKVGNKVRQTIKELGGILPENLPIERHIKELKREKRKLLKNVNKELKK